MAHKLVCVYKCDMDENDAKQREHPDEYLGDVWNVKQIVPLDGSGGGETCVRGGWVFGLLERKH